MLLLLLQDLYRPDANRLRRNLSGIINFAKFREEKLVPYTDLQESVEHLLEETAGLEELNMQLVCLSDSTLRDFPPLLNGCLVLLQHPCMISNFNVGLVASIPTLWLVCEILSIL